MTRKSISLREKQIREADVMLRQASVIPPDVREFMVTAALRELGRNKLKNKKPCQPTT